MKISAKELDYIIEGCKILSCGMINIFKSDIKAAKKAIEEHGNIELTDKFCEDGYACEVYSIRPFVPKVFYKLKKPKDISLDLKVKAIRILEDMIDGKVRALYIPNIECKSLLTAITLSATLKIPLLDADGVGRGVPEIKHHILILHGKKLTPSIMVDSSGMIMAILDYPSEIQYDRVFRRICEVSNSMFIVNGTLRLKEAGKLLLRNSLTECLKLGEALHKAREKGKEPAYTIAEVLGGKVIFKGLITNVNLDVEQGFLVGSFMIRSLDDKHWMEILVKNTTVMAYFEGKVVVLPPDLIVICDKNGNAISNAQIEKGIEVYVIAAPARNIWRSNKGLTILGPKGFDIPYKYTPVEQLISKIPEKVLEEILTAKPT